MRNELTSYFEIVASALKIVSSLTGSLKFCYTRLYYQTVLAARHQRASQPGNKITDEELIHLPGVRNQPSHCSHFKDFVKSSPRETNNPYFQFSARQTRVCYRVTEQMRDSRKLDIARKLFRSPLPDANLRDIVCTRACPESILTCVARIKRRNICHICPFHARRDVTRRKSEESYT